MKHRDIIEKMTLEEKCAYLSGKNAWDTRSFTSIGVDVLHHADGPTGAFRLPPHLQTVGMRSCLKRSEKDLERRLPLKM